METKEQKIKRLKKEKNRLKMCCKRNKHRFGAISLRRQFKIVRQELKELEDDTKKSR